MKTAAKTLFLMLFPLAAIAQSDEEEPIFTIVEEMPTWKGCEKKPDPNDCTSHKISEFIQKNLAYPQAAKDAGTEGTVYIQFIVGKEGKVDETKLLKGIGPECDAEAMRVLAMLPDFNPGTQRGKPVKVVYNIPIRFKMYSAPPPQKR